MFSFSFLAAVRLGFNDLDGVSPTVAGASGGNLALPRGRVELGVFFFRAEMGAGLVFITAIPCLGSQLTAGQKSTARISRMQW
jgi:hypothetical protein